METLIENLKQIRDEYGDVEVRNVRKYHAENGGDEERDEIQIYGWKNLSATENALVLKNREKQLDLLERKKKWEK